MIYTSYYANFRNLPLGMKAYSISRTQPAGFYLHSIPCLMPTIKMLQKYKKTADWNAYVEEYNKEVLQKKEFEVNKVLNYLNSTYDNVVLLCWEGKDKNCHRHLISEYLRSNGIECREY